MEAGIAGAFPGVQGVKRSPADVVRFTMGLETHFQNIVWCSTPSLLTPTPSVIEQPTRECIVRWPVGNRYLGIIDVWIFGLTDSRGNLRELV